MQTSDIYPINSKARSLDVKLLPMTHRERYFLTCADGVDRTAKAIAQMLEMTNPALATQFLTRLKMTLVQERNEYKIYKVRPEKANGAVKWRLEKRNYPIE